MKKTYRTPRAEVIRFAAEPMMASTSIAIPSGKMDHLDTETKDNVDSEGNFWID